MDTIIYIAVMIAVFVIVKRLIFPVAGGNRVKLALNGGAPVLDVRTQPEYDQQAIRGTVNLPLDRISEDTIAELAPDKTKPLLVHCLTGTRSGIATKKLRAFGYAEVYNLGSLPRAKALLKQAGFNRTEDS